MTPRRAEIKLLPFNLEAFNYCLIQNSNIFSKIFPRSLETKNFFLIYLRTNLIQTFLVSIEKDPFPTLSALSKSPVFYAQVTCLLFCRFWKCKISKTVTDTKAKRKSVSSTYEWVEWDMLRKDHKSVIEIPGNCLQIKYFCSENKVHIFCLFF